MPRIWRTEAEKNQLLSQHAGFTRTTTTNNAENAVTFSFEGESVSLIVELYDLYVDFDQDATTSSMLIPAGTGYAETNIYIAGRISIRNATAGQNGRIRGIVWGR